MATSDRYPHLLHSPLGPFERAFALTESDTVDLPEVTSAVYVGGAGALHVLMKDGTEVTFTALPIGLYPLRIRRVFVDTAATNLVGLI